MCWQTNYVIKSCRGPIRLCTIFLCTIWEDLSYPPKALFKLCVSLKILRKKRWTPVSQKHQNYMIRVSICTVLILQTIYVIKIDIMRKKFQNDINVPLKEHFLVGDIIVGIKSEKKICFFRLRSLVLDAAASAHSYHKWFQWMCNSTDAGTKKRSLF